MADRVKEERHNFLAFATDYILFAVALGVINPNTVLPTLAARLGASTTLVGALITVFSVCWTLPQLFAGNVASRFERKKQLMVRMALIGRPIMLALAALIALTRAQPSWLILAALFAAFALFLGTDSFSAVSWYDILGRAFPPERRGSYIALWQVGKSVALLGASALVGFILSAGGPPFPYNYALLFGIAGVLLLGAAFALSRIHEPPTDGEACTSYVAWRDFGRHIVQLWRSDPRLRRISMARVLFTLSTMAFPFYILYATEELRFSTQIIGLFIAAQTAGMLIASLVLGRIADRYGAHRTIQIGALLAVSAPILALAIVFTSGDQPGILHNTYAWIYICMGLSENLMMLGYANYVMDIAPANRRTIYMGTFNTLATIGVFGPTIGGWLLGHTSYPVLFATALACGIGALLWAFVLPSARSQNHSPADPLASSQP